MIRVKYLLADIDQLSCYEPLLSERHIAEYRRRKGIVGLLTCLLSIGAGVVPQPRGSPKDKEMKG